MICNNCKKDNGQGSDFCTQCGFRLQDNSLNFAQDTFYEQDHVYENVDSIKKIEVDPVLETKFEQSNDHSAIANDAASSFTQSQFVCCIKCGHNNSKGTHFCIKCGFTLNQVHANQHLSDHTIHITNSNGTQVLIDDTKGKGMAVSSLVLGITSVLCCNIFILGILAVIFGAISVKNPKYRGMSIAGIILGIISIIIGIIVLIFFPYSLNYNDILNGNNENLVSSVFGLFR